MLCVWNFAQNWTIWGGVNRTWRFEGQIFPGDFGGVNHTWRFEGQIFPDDFGGGKIVQTIWGKLYLAIWGVTIYPPQNHQILCGHMGLFIWHLVSRVFWVKFLFLSQHLKREVGFLNFTTLLLIIYSLLQYNVHLCEICCCKYSKVALRFY